TEVRRVPGQQCDRMRQSDTCDSKVHCPDSHFDAAETSEFGGSGIVKWQDPRGVEIDQDLQQAAISFDDACDFLCGRDVRVPHQDFLVEACDCYEEIGR